MPTETLLKSQRNEVFELVVTAGFQPAEFEWVERNSSYGDGTLRVSALVHRPSEDSWFKFDRDPNTGRHRCLFSPGQTAKREAQFPGDWRPNQLGYVTNWLGYLKRETSSPDLWAALTMTPSTPAIAPNGKFEPSELAVVAERLRAIEAEVADLKKLTAGEATYVHDTLEYLRATAASQGRRDWTNMAIGVVIQIILFLALPAAAAGSLLGFSLAQLQGLTFPFAGQAAAPHPLPGPPPARR